MHFSAASRAALAVVLSCAILSCAKTRDAASAKRGYLERTYKRLQKTVPNEAKLVLVADSIRILFPSKLLFDYDKAVVRTDFLPALDRLAKVLVKRRETSLIILGHTDAIGGDGPSNLDLSQRRADSVRDVLVADKVATTRITTWGRGPKDPIASNETEEGRALNRRVEFVVLYVPTERK
jgi:outer membrane protein OmpA-like peptidoglycan-associated protein